MQTPITQLTLHPILASHPAIDEKTPSVIALVKAISDVGRIFEPLSVNRGRVVAGRERLLAAQILALTEVPTVEIADAEVATVAMQSLLARRHYTKSALAYLAEPIIEAALIETRKRGVEAAKIGASASKTGPLSGLFANSVEDLIEQFGIGRTFFYQARQIRKKFASSPKSFRQRWEPKILEGEMSLGEVAQALAGKLSALDGKTTPKNDAAQLMMDLWATAKVRMDRWAKLAPKDRAVATAKFRDEFLPSLPDELLEEAERYIATRLANA